MKDAKLKDRVISSLHAGTISRPMHPARPVSPSRSDEFNETKTHAEVSSSFTVQGKWDENLLKDPRSNSGLSKTLEKAALCPLYTRPSRRGECSPCSVSIGTEFINHSCHSPELHAVSFSTPNGKEEGDDRPEALNTRRRKVNL